MKKQNEPDIVYEELRKREKRVFLEKTFDKVKKKIEFQMIVDSLVFICLSFLVISVLCSIIIEISGNERISMAIFFVTKFMIVPSILFTILIIVSDKYKNSKKGGEYEENNTFKV
mgnify:CR=1 FL=1